MGFQGVDYDLQKWRTAEEGTGDGHCYSNPRVHGEGAHALPPSGTFRRHGHTVFRVCRVWSATRKRSKQFFRFHVAI